MAIQKKITRRRFLIAGSVAAVLAPVPGFFGIREVWSILDAEHAWATTQVQPLDATIGVTRHLSILPLIDKYGQGTLRGEWGVSYLVKTDQATILLDVGQNADGSAPLLSNMAQLGITPDSFDTLVFSHNHPDHVGGMQQVIQHTLSLGGPTNLDGKRVLAPVPMTYPGTSVVVAKDPTVIAPGVATTGTIAYPEIVQMWLVTGQENVEQSLVVNVEGKGLVVIAGCGHPTLQKMLPRAAALVHAPVYGFVGGLHFMDSDARALQPTIDFLKPYSLSLVAPSAHDSGTAALDALRTAFPDAYRAVVVGQEIVVAA